MKQYKAWLCCGAEFETWGELQAHRDLHPKDGVERLWSIAAWSGDDVTPA